MCLHLFTCHSSEVQVHIAAPLCIKSAWLGLNYQCWQLIVLITCDNSVHTFMYLQWWRAYESNLWIRKFMVFSEPCVSTAKCHWVIETYTRPFADPSKAPRLHLCLINRIVPFFRPPIARCILVMNILYNAGTSLGDVFLLWWCSAVF